MSSTELLIMIILLELVIIVGLVLATVLILSGRRRRREKRAAENLAQRVRSEEPSRDSELRSLLQGRFGYSGDALEEKVREIKQAETAFYRRFLDLYLNRDPEAAEQLQEYLEDAIRPYANIEPAAADDDGETADSDDGAEPSEGGAPPTMDGRDMYEEIRSYRDTLNLVFAEYTAMFGINQDRNAQLSAREIKERMESGQLAGPDDDSS